MKYKYHIIRDCNLSEPPKEHEEFAAQVIADYFKCNVIFVMAGNGKTPDIKS